MTNFPFKSQWIWNIFLWSNFSYSWLLFLSHFDLDYFNDRNEKDTKFYFSIKSLKRSNYTNFNIKSNVCLLLCFEWFQKAVGCVYVRSEYCHFSTLDDKFFDISKVGEEDARICQFIWNDLKLLLHFVHQLILCQDWFLVKEKVLPQIMFDMRE